jgi:hypothetical protein
MFSSALLACSLLVSIFAGPVQTSRVSPPRTGFLLQSQSDPISGDWDVIFKVESSSTPATMNLKVEGGKVTGTANSAHTGPGVIRDGSWENNKLRFMVDFKAHESIEISGTLKDGMLTGEFRTEGFVSNWEGKRKAPTSEKTAPADQSVAPSGDPVSGNWDAALEAQSKTFRVMFMFKLEGNKVTGNSKSDLVGENPISDGAWVDNKLTFTMPGPHGPIHFSGALTDGKLAGEFLMGQMKGKWDAERK